MKRLLNEARQLWTSGKLNEAIEKSEEALTIRKSLYGSDHSLVIEVEAQLNTARQNL